MKEYSCGCIGVRFAGFGGTWRAVERHEKGFLLWESETHGAKVKKLLTDKVGNVLINGVVSFSDFAVRAKISEYENIRDSITCEQILERMAMQKKEKSKDSSKKGDDVASKNAENVGTAGNTTSTQTATNAMRPAPRKPSGKNPHVRESVISKLHEYQTYVNSTKKKAQ